MEDVEDISISPAARFKSFLLNWRVWAFFVGIVALLVLVQISGRAKTAASLGDAVDTFRCCILTWKAVVIVLPAFLAAGAIVTFVPETAVIRYLGRRTAKWKSYSVGSIAGMVLSVCSCNIVPIFMGILRRGAGLGPAYAFAYAGPAINIVTIIMVMQVIDAPDHFPIYAAIRTLAVPIISIIGGVTMAILFHKEDVERQKLAEAQSQKGLDNLVGLPQGSGKHAIVIVGIVLSILLFGAWDTMGTWIKDTFALRWASTEAVESINWEIVGITVRILAALALIALAIRQAVHWYSREEAIEWMRQTWILTKSVLPIFIPAVIVIGIILQWIPMTWLVPTAGNTNAFVFGYPQGNGFLQVLVSAIFGSIMYFPLLTEIAFVKGMLLQNLAPGCAMAILLSGPGLSLPGIILLYKVVGFRKALAYFIIMTLLVTLVSYTFGVTAGKYACVCMYKR